MAKKTTELPIKTTDLSTVDQLIFVDSGDTTDSPEGTDKRVAATRMALTDGLEARITGGGTVSLGGFSLTASKDGTLATADDLTTGLADKADTAYVDSQDALKADTTYVDAADAALGTQIDLKQDELTTTITGTGTIDTGTAGSLSLGEAVLTTGDKTGVIATEDDLAELLDVIRFPIDGLIDGSGITEGYLMSGFRWKDAYLPSGYTVKLCAYLYHGSGTQTCHLKINQIASSEISSGSNIYVESSFLTLVDETDYSLSCWFEGDSVNADPNAAGVCLLLEPPV